MKLPIFRPAAAADVEDAYRWYETQRPGLGEDFLTAVSAVIESLKTYPERFPIVYRQARRANLRRFPYSLFYRIIEDQVIILACMHGRRHPRNHAIDRSLRLDAYLSRANIQLLDLPPFVSFQLRVNRLQQTVVIKPFHIHLWEWRALRLHGVDCRAGGDVVDVRDAW